MARTKQKDNSTYREKVALRKRALGELAALGVNHPVICETHGGEGKLWEACYQFTEHGIAFEKDPARTGRLAMQRQGWAIYEADCVQALKLGVGAHLAVDLLDCDPYGGALDVVSSYFESPRPFAPVMAVVVNDGMRQALSMGAAWSIKALEPFVLKYGNDALYQHYGDICGEFIHEKAAAVSYSVSRFVFYYCGKKNFVTHWYALLTRSAA